MSVWRRRAARNARYKIRRLSQQTKACTFATKTRIFIMPQRHSKRNTNAALFTKWEFEKAGYGSKKRRVGKDSMKPFDCCWICLHALTDPICTPDGYLFCKECILESLLKQKQDIKKNKEAYEKQLSRLSQEAKDAELAADAARIQRFEKTELDIPASSASRASSSSTVSIERRIKDTAPLINDGKVSDLLKAKIAREAEADIIRGSDSTSNALSSSLTSKTAIIERDGITATKVGGVLRAGRENANFWIAQNTPQESSTRSLVFEKPVTHTVNPVSNAKLRVKELYPVKLTENPDEDDDVNKERDGRFICPLTSKTLINGMDITFIKSTGLVYTSEAVKTMILQDGVCPITGKKVRSKDCISIQTGGTGFASKTQKTEKAEVKTFSTPMN